MRLEVFFFEENNKCYFRIPTLSIIAVGDDASRAYQEILNEKNKYFNLMIDLGYEEDIIKVCHQARPYSLSFKVRSLLVRYAFIFVLIVSTIGTGSFVVKTIFMNSIPKASQLVLKESKKLSKRLNKSIDRSIETPAAKKKERILRLRKYLNSMSPYIEEVQRVFSSQELNEKR